MAFKISRPPTDTSAPPSGMTLSMVERNWPLSSKTRRETVGARLHRRGFRIDPTTIRPLGAWSRWESARAATTGTRLRPPHSCRCRFHSGLYYYFSGVLDSAGKNDYFLRNYDTFFRYPDRFLVGDDCCDRMNRTIRQLRQYAGVDARG